MINVLVVDDHTILRDGLRALLNGAQGMHVVGDAANGFEAITAATQLQPDVAVMDIKMPGIDGIETAIQMVKVCPKLQIVFLSMYDDPRLALRALRAGALGYVLKGSSGAELIEAIRSVYQGRTYRSNRISEAVIYEVVHRDGRNRDLHPLAKLTDRERQVFFLILDGKGTGAIADLLHLSPKTVSTYRTRMMTKLELVDVPTLVRFAISHGLLPEHPESPGGKDAPPDH